ncbi:MAG: hypothetical protein WEF50_13595 [Myxococcota bacterium]
MQLARLLVGLGLVLACGPAEPDAVAPSAPVAAPAPDSLGRLDPAPYRASIEAAEALLYSTDALSDEDWKALSTEFLELHNAIVFGDGSTSARETSAQLFFLSARADAIKSSSRDEVELTELRQQWEELSEAKFTPATWIRAQSPEH